MINNIIRSKQNTLLLILVVQIMSCSEKQETKKTAQSLDLNLLGYWTPKEISWKHPNSGNVNIDTTIRYATFNIIHFGEDERLEIFKSTNSYPKGYDSIIFEYEPGINIYEGKWTAVYDSIIAVYRQTYSQFDRVSESLTKESWYYVKANPTVILGGIEYEQNKLLDRKSLEKINAYRDEKK